MTCEPSGHGPSIGVPRTTCVGSTSNGRVGRPDRASSRDTMVDFLPNPKITRPVSHARGTPSARGADGPLTVPRRAAPPAALLSAGDLFAPSERLRHPGHPCRAGGRPRHGFGRGADLPDVDLQAGRRRRSARRLRVLALRQPDPDRARGVLRRARGRGARGRSPAGPGGRPPRPPAPSPPAPPAPRPPPPPGAPPPPPPGAWPA